jgi:hypothetical protein
MVANSDDLCLPITWAMVVNEIAMTGTLSFESSVRDFFNATPIGYETCHDRGDTF